MTTATELAALMQRNPLHHVGHVEFEGVATHLKVRLNYSLCSDNSSVQFALKKAIRALAEVERQLEITEVESSINEDKRRIREAQKTVKDNETRLAELKGDGNG
ncbi:hypothetical protein [Mycolicibacterium sphagni]|uniref:hypothetical protein n=1 Tax=Mycolicibacterium sphagni TaxID=1786 RepID=UPI0021F37E68|nr:hypothetical protein [Mycolicibacterium sphagni]MCV7175091.1 hypothetical protein [Mycolicibacterium sphagni]